MERGNLPLANYMAPLFYEKATEPIWYFNINDNIKLFQYTDC